MIQAKVGAKDVAIVDLFCHPVCVKFQQYDQKRHLKPVVMIFAPMLAQGLLE
jgi:hypothetical protein